MGAQGLPISLCACKSVSGSSERLCSGARLYIAKSAEIAGVRSETISVPQEIKASQMWKEIETQHPGLTDVSNQVIFAVHQEYVKLGDQLIWLQPGDKIAIIHPPPPLVEASAFKPCRKDTDDVEDKAKDTIQFTAEKLPVDEVSQLVISLPCGAVSLFVAHRAASLEAVSYAIDNLKAKVPMDKGNV
uniref:Uncharacterized protein n=1 Tax=Oryctolagus cuniculus TaxID=9986 RepID=A0A5F9CZV2_RABIT